MANHIDTLPLLTELPCQSADGPYTFAFRPDPECYEDMVSFFREYGFVVVKNIFSKEECEATRSAMWDVLEEQNKGISRSNPKTWSNLKSKGKVNYLSSANPTD